MDPDYYDRRASSELKKVAAETKKRSDLEAQAAKEDSAALRDEASLSPSSSDNTRRSKTNSAARHRKKAAELRGKAAVAGLAAGKAQTAANKAQTDASAERQRRAAKAAADAKKADARGRREAERKRRDDERDRAAAERRVAADLSSLESETERLAVRTLELQQALTESRREAPPKVTVLLIAGTPEGGATPLRLDREAREIDLKVLQSAFRDHIELRWTQATQVRDIIDALNRHQPDVVHFSGHGAETELLFEGPDGTPLALSGEQLATLLQTAPRRIRLMVFNACNSAVQAEAATEWAEFAIGMERPIGDESAKEWAGQFYGSLGSGMSIGRAFAQATAQAEVLTSVAATGNPLLFDNGTSDPEATVLVGL